MINKYYQRELSRLHELAAEFARANPGLAPMLSGPRADPDVERLLEGSAFLSGLIHERLDDDFPEMVHGLMQLIFPHYLHPIPSTTIIQFKPRSNLMEKYQVKAGTQIASKPVNGVSCLFTTSTTVDLYPLEITRVELEQQAGSKPRLAMEFKLKAMPLAAMSTDTLSLHVTGDATNAAEICWSLIRHTEFMRLLPASGQGSALTLNKKNLRLGGFTDDQSLLPYPSQSFSAYRLLQEFFILPEKFHFLHIDGFNQWINRGTSDSFRLEFNFDAANVTPPEYKKKNFVLFATTAINLFPESAQPILLDHRQPEYRVIPAGGQDNKEVYSIRRVTGFIQGASKPRDYEPFEMFNPNVEMIPVYSIHHRRSVIDDKTDLLISVAYPPQAGIPKPETLSIDILCTNGDLSRHLHYGDINQPTDTSPELATFENILPPTATVQPPLGRNLLWRLLSHLYLNYLSMANPDSLRAIAKLYIFPETTDRAKLLTNTRRVEGIRDLQITASYRLVSGIMMRGQDIHLSLDPQNFSGVGDMFMFGAVLQNFLARYAAINCFTQVTVENSNTKESYTWRETPGSMQIL